MSPPVICQHTKKFPFEERRSILFSLMAKFTRRNSSSPQQPILRLGKSIHVLIVRTLIGIFSPKTLAQSTPMMHASLWHWMTSKYHLSNAPRSDQGMDWDKKCLLQVYLAFMLPISTSESLLKFHLVFCVKVNGCRDTECARCWSFHCKSESDSKTLQNYEVFKLFLKLFFLLQSRAITNNDFLTLINNVGRFGYPDPTYPHTQAY